MNMKYCRRCSQKTERYDSGKCRSCVAAYNIAHKDTKRAWSAAWYSRPENKSQMRARAAMYDALPKRRAINFLRHNPDCTSTIDDVTTMYALECHAVTGKPGKIGNGSWDLVLGHVHNGPAVGLMYGWENKALSDEVQDNWSAFVDTVNAQHHTLLVHQVEGWT